MPIYIGQGANPKAIYKGSSLGKVYMGMDLVWQKETIAPEFIFSIAVGNETIILPLLDGYTYDFTVDWGDGSPVGSVTAYNDVDATHIYSEPGEYDITINGTCQCFTIYNDLEPWIFDIYQYITSIKQWGSCDFRKINFAFCENLISIPNSKITGMQNIVNLDYLFMYCHNLAIQIQNGFFDNCINITSVYSCFEGTLVTSIPSNLFRNNVKITNFDRCFSGTQITSIPAGLFDNCILALTFELTFAVTQITSIPAGLFDSCTLVTSFYSTFTNCSLLLSIPNELFKYNINVINFHTCFGMTQITSIPAGLFDSCTLVTSFEGCFYRCNFLTGNAPDIWNKYPYADGTVCFYLCTGLENYADIPSNWK